MSDGAHQPFDGAGTLYAIGALREDDRRTFEEHLEVCRECVEEAMSLLPLAQGLAQSVARRDVPVALRTRVIERATGEPHHAPTSASELIIDHGRPVAAPKRSAIGRILFAVAVMICLAAAGGLGWYAAQQVNLARDLQAEVDVAGMRLSVAELEAATARQSMADSRNRAVVLAAPDLTTVELQGQPGAAGATGRAFWSPSTGVVVAAAGLPAVPEGSTYQLWLVTPPTPMSAGLLQTDEAGRIFATVEPPAEGGIPTAIAITLEPAGGVEAPTGEVYLLGRTDQ